MKLKNFVNVVTICKKWWGQKNVPGPEQDAVNLALFSVNAHFGSRGLNLFMKWASMGFDQSGNPNLSIENMWKNMLLIRLPHMVKKGCSIEVGYIIINSKDERESLVMSNRIYSSPEAALEDVYVDDNVIAQEIYWFKKGIG